MCLLPLYPCTLVTQLSIAALGAATHKAGRDAGFMIGRCGLWYVDLRFEYLDSARMNFQLDRFPQRYQLAIQGRVRVMLQAREV